MGRCPRPAWTKKSLHFNDLTFFSRPAKSQEIPRQLAHCLPLAKRRPGKESGARVANVDSLPKIRQGPTLDYRKTVGDPAGLERRHHSRWRWSDRGSPCHGRRRNSCWISLHDQVGRHGRLVSVRFLARSRSRTDPRALRLKQIAERLEKDLEAAAALTRKITTRILFERWRAADLQPWGWHGRQTHRPQGQGRIHASAVRAARAPRARGHGDRSDQAGRSVDAARRGEDGRQAAHRQHAAHRPEADVPFALACELVLRNPLDAVSSATWEALT